MLQGPFKDFNSCIKKGCLDNFSTFLSGHYLSLQLKFHVAIAIHPLQGHILHFCEYRLLGCALVNTPYNQSFTKSSHTQLMQPCSH